MGDMDKIRANKKIVLSVLGVLVVIVIAAGAGIGLRLIQNENAKDNDGGKPAFKGQALPADVDEAQNLRLSGDVDGSLKKIDESLAKDSVSSAEKYQLYIQQGNAYVEKGDKPAGINAYVEADKVTSTFETTSLLASMYEEAGNKAKALEYYKKALPLIPDSPMRVQYKTDIQQKIQTLEGQS